MVVRTERLPAPGETVIGGEFHTFPGGKGANQAVAAARLGARVSFLCKTGRDALGDAALAGFAAEGIDLSYAVRDDDAPSGVALITVDAAGQNEIVVAPGANGTLSAADVDAAEEAFRACALALTQLETTQVAVERTVELTRRHGKPLILNPAPARDLDDVLLDGLYAITPNETEAERLTGIAVADAQGATQAAHALRERGVRHVVVTLGARGAYYLGEEGETYIPAPQVEAVDTTAAGDVFNGALAVALGEGRGWAEAVAFANRAAAVSVTRMGAQASAPRRGELA